MSAPDPACVVMTIGPAADTSCLLQSWSAMLSVHAVILVETASLPGPLAHNIASMVGGDRRVRRLRWAGYGHCLADALDLVGPCGWIVFLADGYALTSSALQELTSSADADAAYGDETAGGVPFHKPAWSLDLALEQDVAGGVAAIRAGMLGPVTGVLLEAPHDIMLRLPATARIRHVPRLMSRTNGARRDAPGPSAVQFALERFRGSGVEPRLQASAIRQGRMRVTWRAAPAPLVSIVIPTRDHADLLQRCVAGLLDRTDYPALELVIADNGSTEPATLSLLASLSADARVKVLPVPGPFNYARINNQAVGASTGEIVVLLNNDIEVLEPQWLAEMVGLAMRPETGVVGAKLLYPDGTVQHGGVVLGIGSFEGGPGIAGYFGYGESRTAPGYAGQLAITRQVSAVTAACLAVRRLVWDGVGGLDAETFAVALNDVDFCLRVRAAGLAVVWTPHAVLLHRESASRGSDEAPATRERFRRECRALRDRWGAELDADPFYNANFTRADHQFRLGP